MFESLSETAVPEFFLQFAVELPLAELSLAVGFATVGLILFSARQLGADLHGSASSIATFAPMLASCAAGAFLVHRRARAKADSLFRGNGWIPVFLLGIALLAYAQFLSRQNDIIAARAAAQPGDYFTNLLANDYQDPLGIAFAIALPGLGAAAYGFARLFFWLNGLRSRNKPQPGSA